MNNEKNYLSTGAGFQPSTVWWIYATCFFFVPLNLEKFHRCSSGMSFWQWICLAANGPWWFPLVHGGPGELKCWKHHKIYNMHIWIYNTCKFEKYVYMYVYKNVSVYITSKSFYLCLYPSYTSGQCLWYANLCLSSYLWISYYSLQDNHWCQEFSAALLGRSISQTPEKTNTVWLTFNFETEQHMSQVPVQRDRSSIMQPSSVFNWKILDFCI